MELTWSLDELYADPASLSFTNDFHEFGKQLAAMDEWIDKNLTDPANAVAKLEYCLMSGMAFCRFDNLFLYTELSLAVDTTNEKMLKWADKLDELAVRRENQIVRIKNFITEISDWPDCLEQSRLLSEHAFILNEMRGQASFMMRVAEENVAASMKTTGSNLWRKLWEQTTSTLLIEDPAGQVESGLPLSQIRNLAHSESAKLRKAAYERELASYPAIEKICAFALNAIKGEALTLCRMRGHENPLAQAIQEARMDRETLFAMLEAIAEFRPVFESYFKRKADLLRHKNGLPFYDLFAPLGKSGQIFTPESARDFIVAAFSAFSENMGHFAADVFEHRHIDFLPREGKIGGAFCENLHYVKQSRILTNFSGSFDSVVTLAHELGHAYHNSCLSGQTCFNAEPSLPMAETASAFAEMLVTAHALSQAKNDAQALRILESDLQGIAQTAIDIYSRFLFEDELFRQRNDSSLSVPQIKAIMTDAQQKAYGEGLDPDFLHPYMWCCKTHYYDGDSHYYNFPYAYGSLLSRGLYTLYNKDKEGFPALYDKMLSASGKQSLSDSAALCGIRIQEKAFWLKSLSLVKNDIERFMELTQPPAPKRKKG